MPTAMNCLGGINTLTKLFSGFTKWLWQAKMFLVDSRMCSHPLPSLSNLWSFIYDVCKKNKALNQGVWAVKATPMLSLKCRDIIPAVKPFPLSQPQGKSSQVFCCSFSSVYVHTSGGAKKKGGKLSTKQFSSTQGAALRSPLTCYMLRKDSFVRLSLRQANTNPQPPQEVESWNHGVCMGSARLES